MDLLWLKIFILFKIVVVIDGKGFIETNFIGFENFEGRRFDGKCCDKAGWWSSDKTCSNECDHRFVVCMGNATESSSMAACEYGKKEIDTVGGNKITFNGNVGGISNPVKFPFKQWPGVVKLKIDVQDADDDDEYDFVDHFDYQYNTKDMRRELDAPVKSLVLTGTRTKFDMQLKVYCDINYFGSDCSTFCKETDDQTGHYRCDPADGSKICMQGWTGLDCRTNIDDCYGNGCYAGSTCVDGVNYYTCACPPGRTGTRCEAEINECASRPCQNGGRCFDASNSFRCECKPGFVGPLCEIDYDECMDRPCLNGGVCTEGIGTYTCSCKPGFRGDRCEIDINECDATPCVRAEQCIDLPGDYRCQCFSGFTGKNCDIGINECESNPCQNDGICSDELNGYSCICQYGFTGPNCAHRVDFCGQSNCLNGATCFNTDTGYYCQCTYAFTGLWCEDDVDECEETPNLCGENGRCANLYGNYFCDCNAGYTGRNCQTEIDECSEADTPCLNEGTCVDMIGMYRCECAQGFTGPKCQDNINECLSSPCLNSGYCVDDINGYLCRCPIGYTGEHCEELTTSTTSTSASTTTTTSTVVATTPTVAITTPTAATTTSTVATTTPTVAITTPTVAPATSTVVATTPTVAPATSTVVATTPTVATTTSTVTTTIPTVAPATSTVATNTSTDATSRLALADNTTASDKISIAPDETTALPGQITEEERVTSETTETMTEEQTTSSDSYQSTANFTITDVYKRTENDTSTEMYKSTDSTFTADEYQSTVTTLITDGYAITNATLSADVYKSTDTALSTDGYKSTNISLSTDVYESTDDSLSQDEYKSTDDMLSTDVYKSTGYFWSTGDNKSASIREDSTNAYNITDEGSTYLPVSNVTTESLSILTEQSTIETTAVTYSVTEEDSSTRDESGTEIYASGLDSSGEYLSTSGDIDYDSFPGTNVSSTELPYIWKESSGQVPGDSKDELIDYKEFNLITPIEESGDELFPTAVGEAIIESGLASGASEIIEDLVSGESKESGEQIVKGSGTGIIDHESGEPVEVSGEKMIGESGDAFKEFGRGFTSGEGEEVREMYSGDASGLSKEEKYIESGDTLEEFESGLTSTESGEQKGMFSGEENLASGSGEGYESGVYSVDSGEKIFSSGDILEEFESGLTSGESGEQRELHSGEEGYAASGLVEGYESGIHSVESGETMTVESGDSLKEFESGSTSGESGESGESGLTSGEGDEMLSGEKEYETSGSEELIVESGYILEGFESGLTPDEKGEGKEMHSRKKEYVASGLTEEYESGLHSDESGEEMSMESGDSLKEFESGLTSGESVESGLTSGEGGEMFSGEKEYETSGSEEMIVESGDILEGFESGLSSEESGEGKEMQSGETEYVRSGLTEEYESGLHSLESGEEVIVESGMHSIGSGEEVNDESGDAMKEFESGLTSEEGDKMREMYSGEKEYSTSGSGEMIVESGDILEGFESGLTPEESGEGKDMYSGKKEYITSGSGEMIIESGDKLEGFESGLAPEESGEGKEMYSGEKEYITSGTEEMIVESGDSLKEIESGLTSGESGESGLTSGEEGESSSGEKEYKTSGSEEMSVESGDKLEGFESGLTPEESGEGKEMYSGEKEYITSGSEEMIVESGDSLKEFESGLTSGESGESGLTSGEEGEILSGEKEYETSTSDEMIVESGDILKGFESGLTSEESGEGKEMQSGESEYVASGSTEEYEYVVHSEESGGVMSLESGDALKEFTSGLTSGDGDQMRETHSGEGMVVESGDTKNEFESSVSSGESDGVDKLHSGEIEFVASGLAEEYESSVQDVESGEKLIRGSGDEQKESESRLTLEQSGEIHSGEEDVTQGYADGNESGIHSEETGEEIINKSEDALKDVGSGLPSKEIDEQHPMQPGEKENVTSGLVESLESDSHSVESEDVSNETLLIESGDALREFESGMMPDKESNASVIPLNKTGQEYEGQDTTGETGSVAYKEEIAKENVTVTETQSTLRPTVTHADLISTNLSSKTDDMSTSELDITRWTDSFKVVTNKTYTTLSSERIKEVPKDTTIDHRHVETTTQNMSTVSELTYTAEKYSTIDETTKGEIYEDSTDEKYAITSIAESSSNHTRFSMEETTLSMKQLPSLNVTTKEQDSTSKVQTGSLFSYTTTAKTFKTSGTSRGSIKPETSTYNESIEQIITGNPHLPWLAAHKHIKSSPSYETHTTPFIPNNPWLFAKKHLNRIKPKEKKKEKNVTKSPKLKVKTTLFIQSKDDAAFTKVPTPTERRHNDTAEQEKPFKDLTTQLHTSSTSLKSSPFVDISVTKMITTRLDKSQNLTHEDISVTENVTKSHVTENVSLFPQDHTEKTHVSYPKGTYSSIAENATQTKEPTDLETTMLTHDVTTAEKLTSVWQVNLTKHDSRATETILRSTAPYLSTTQIPHLETTLKDANTSATTPLPSKETEKIIASLNETEKLTDVSPTFQTITHLELKSDNEITRTNVSDTTGLTLAFDQTTNASVTLNIGILATDKPDLFPSSSIVKSTIEPIQTHTIDIEIESEISNATEVYATKKETSALDETSTSTTNIYEPAKDSFTLIISTSPTHTENYTVISVSTGTGETESKSAMKNTTWHTEHPLTTPSTITSQDIHENTTAGIDVSLSTAHEVTDKDKFHTASNKCKETWCIDKISTQAPFLSPPSTSNTLEHTELNVTEKPVSTVIYEGYSVQSTLEMSLETSLPDMTTQSVEHTSSTTVFESSYTDSTQQVIETTSSASKLTAAKHTSTSIVSVSPTRVEIISASQDDVQSVTKSTFEETTWHTEHPVTVTSITHVQKNTPMMGTTVAYLSVSTDQDVTGEATSHTPSKECKESQCINKIPTLTPPPPPPLPPFPLVTAEKHKELNVTEKPVSAVIYERVSVQSSDELVPETSYTDVTTQSVEQISSKTLFETSHTHFKRYRFRHFTTVTSDISSASTIAESTMSAGVIHTKPLNMLTDTDYVTANLSERTTGSSSVTQEQIVTDMHAMSTVSMIRILRPPSSITFFASSTESQIPEGTGVVVSDELSIQSTSSASDKSTATPAVEALSTTERQEEIVTLFSVSMPLTITPTRVMEMYTAMTNSLIPISASSSIDKSDSAEILSSSREEYGSQLYSSFLPSSPGLSENALFTLEHKLSSAEIQTGSTSFSTLPSSTLSIEFELEKVVSSTQSLYTDESQSVIETTFSASKLYTPVTDTSTRIVTTSQTSVEIDTITSVSPGDVESVTKLTFEESTWHTEHPVTIPSDRTSSHVQKITTLLSTTGAHHSVSTDQYGSDKAPSPTPSQTCKEAGCFIKTDVSTSDLLSTTSSIVEVVSDKALSTESLTFIEVSSISESSTIDDLSLPSTPDIQIMSTSMPLSAHVTTESVSNIMEKNISIAVSSTHAALSTEIIPETDLSTESFISITQTDLSIDNPLQRTPDSLEQERSTQATKSLSTFENIEEATTSKSIQNVTHEVNGSSIPTSFAALTVPKSEKSTKSMFTMKTTDVSHSGEEYLTPNVKESEVSEPVTFKTSTKSPLEKSPYTLNTSVTDSVKPSTPTSSAGYEADLRTTESQTTTAKHIPGLDVESLTTSVQSEHTTSDTSKESSTDKRKYISGKVSDKIGTKKDVKSTLKTWPRLTTQKSSSSPESVSRLSSLSITEGHTLKTDKTTKMFSKVDASFTRVSSESTPESSTLEATHERESTEDVTTYTTNIVVVSDSSTIKTDEPKLPSPTKKTDKSTDPEIFVSTQTAKSTVFPPSRSGVAEFDEQSTLSGHTAKVTQEVIHDTAGSVYDELPTEGYEWLWIKRVFTPKKEIYLTPPKANLVVRKTQSTPDPQKIVSATVSPYTLKTTTFTSDLARSSTQPYAGSETNISRESNYDIALEIKETIISVEQDKMASQKPIETSSYSTTYLTPPTTNLTQQTSKRPELSTSTRKPAVRKTQSTSDPQKIVSSTVSPYTLKTTTLTSDLAQSSTQPYAGSETNISRESNNDIALKIKETIISVEPDNMATQKPIETSSYSATYLTPPTANLTQQTSKMTEPSISTRTRTPVVRKTQSIPDPQKIVSATVSPDTLKTTMVFTIDSNDSNTTSSSLSSMKLSSKFSTSMPISTFTEDAGEHTSIKDSSEVGRSEQTLSETDSYTNTPWSSSTGEVLTSAISTTFATAEVSETTSSETVSQFSSTTTEETWSSSADDILSSKQSQFISTSSPTVEVTATTSFDKTAITSSDETATTSSDQTATTSSDQTAITSSDQTATTSSDQTANTSASFPEPSASNASYIGTITVKSNVSLGTLLRSTLQPENIFDSENDTVTNETFFKSTFTPIASVTPSTVKRSYIRHKIDLTSNNTYPFPRKEIYEYDRNQTLKKGRARLTFNRIRVTVIKSVSTAIEAGKKIALRTYQNVKNITTSITVTTYNRARQLLQDALGRVEALWTYCQTGINHFIVKPLLDARVYVKERFTTAYQRLGEVFQRGKLIFKTTADDVREETQTYFQNLANYYTGVYRQYTEEVRDIFESLKIPKT